MSETLDLIGMGWKLQRGYKISPQWAYAEDKRELGNVASTAVAEKNLRSLDLTYRTNQSAAEEYVRSFFDRNVGPVARFLFPFPEYVPSPDAAPTLTAIVSGNQAQRTISVSFAWKNSTGTTRGSPAGMLVVPANNLIKVALPIFPPSVNQAVIYATQIASVLEEQTTLTNTRAWTQPNAALLTGTADSPTANTAKETPLCRLIDSYSLTRGDGLTWELSLRIEEAY